MPHIKLTEADEHFLEAPQGALMISAGASGTESFIERKGR